ncbi:MAG: aldehyde dehydrogenase family protein, partial [Rhodoplanes sp.]
MITYGHFIGGRRVAGASSRFVDGYEPMTGEVYSKVALASREEVRAAVQDAAAAQPAWGATNPQRRARVLMRFLELANRRATTGSAGDRARKRRSACRIA